MSKKLFTIIITVVIIIAGALGIKSVMKDNENTETPGYKDIAITTEQKAVSDEEIETTLHETIDAAGGNYVNIDNDETVKEGYIVTVEYHAEGEEESSETMEVTAGIPGYFYPESFAQAVLGLKVGESATAEMPVEEDKTVTDKLTVISATKPDYDNITDEFVKNLEIENVSTVDELKGSIREFLEKEHEEQFREEVREEIRNSIINGSEAEADLPLELIEAHKKDITTELEAVQAVYMEQGEEKSLEDIISTYIKEEGYNGTVIEYIDAEAKSRAGISLIFDKIAKKEGLSISDDEIDKLVSEHIMNLTGNEPVYSEIESYIEKRGVENVKSILIERKVLDQLLDYYLAKE